MVLVVEMEEIKKKKSKKTSLMFFRPSPPSNILYCQCVWGNLHPTIKQREYGRRLADVPTNVSGAQLFYEYMFCATSCQIMNC